MEVNFKKIEINKIIQSQAGVLNVKRKQLSYRLHLAEKKGLNFPKKRVFPTSKIDLSNKIEVIEKKKMQILSKEMVLRNVLIHKEDFEKEMEPHIAKMVFYKKIYRWSLFPKRVAGKIIKFRIRRK